MVWMDLPQISAISLRILLVVVLSRVSQNSRSFIFFIVILILFVISFVIVIAKVNFILIHQTII